jgi:hypothetical protein
MERDIYCRHHRLMDSYPKFFASVEPSSAEVYTTFGRRNHGSVDEEWDPDNPDLEVIEGQLSRVFRHRRNYKADRGDGGSL